ncbi:MULTISPECIES: patatin-like phospholipase family protein [unclassified Nocardioides]|uniref:patatin-like phospholipase family protein n=1 Tax=unclassified Nocardioides TaxID=2615069 RepID=UPI0009F04916|nr:MULTISPECIES: patatin-like phospholipase family protein [unclassified Nocardioides]GAW51971.1 patatin [Nocardioides sp. PD653-B2]GAW56423.1 patatin [Nocardioides sp. PD653]
MSSLRVALALGSGGARGYAHIGAVEEIRARGHEIVAVAGSSMGALVGGLMCAGHLDEYTQWARSLSQRDVIRLLDPKWSAPGAIGAGRIFDEVERLVGGLQIEDLPVAFTAVATDLHARREVWFQRGPLTSALRASIAIPGVITPVVMNGRLLADGGLMNPVPIEPTAASAADLTVAISLQGARTAREPATPAREPAPSTWREELVERVRRTVGRPAEPDSEPTLLDQLRISDVVGMSMDAMQGLITRYRMAGLPPDVLVTVPVGAARSLDFHRAAEMIELGRTLTAAALDAAGR